MDYFISNYNVSCLNGADSVVLEDSIMQKGYPVTAGSKMLESFTALFDAAVVEKLKAADAVILGKTKMDEFGASGLFDKSEQLSAAVSAVADGVSKFGLCNDYTGATAMQAAEQGLCYIHPTYGTVSRYGLIASASSMDQIGVVCRSPEDGFKMLSVISGYDERDGAMFPENTAAAHTADADFAKLRIGAPSNLCESGFDASSVGQYAQNHILVGFEMKYFDVYEQLMQILCCAELSNNISRYDGIKFGHRAKEYNSLRELYTKSRTEGFGMDVKLAAVAGAMVLSQDNYSELYDHAMRVRNLVRGSLDFDAYDVIAMPAPCLSRLCGLPSITMRGEGGAITFIADACCEDILRNFAAKAESAKD